METLMNLTIAEIFGGAAGVVILLSIFIEITPIKLNPVSSFLRWLGEKINKDVIERVDVLEKKMDSIESSNSKRDAVNCRVRILRYADEMRVGIRHSKESFDQILDDIDSYKRYCENHADFKNSKAVAATEIILSTYAECMDKNDFL